VACGTWSKSGNWSMMYVRCQSRFLSTKRGNKGRHRSWTMSAGYQPPVKTRRSFWDSLGVISDPVCLEAAIRTFPCPSSTHGSWGPPSEPGQLRQKCRVMKGWECGHGEQGRGLLNRWQQISRLKPIRVGEGRSWNIRGS